eukprot:1361066-Rhodomonas_salina.1
MELAFSNERRTVNSGKQRRPTVVLQCCRAGIVSLHVSKSPPVARTKHGTLRKWAPITQITTQQ